MSLSASLWPSFAGAPAPERLAPPRGALVVWRVELIKLTRLVRVQVIFALCALVPFLVAAAVKVQSAVPADTLFGQWLHESGFALPMVVVGFAGQWVLPLLTAIVAGDIFAAEDHFGTWKTILTRSCGRGAVFAGKTLAAVTYTVASLVVLAASSILAGLTLGTAPVVGLSGQLVPAGHALTLVVQSWAIQLPPLLAFCFLAILLSVLTRSPVIGIGAPVVLGLVMQLTSFINLPAVVREGLLTTPFAAWHGLWVQQEFLGPLWHGLLTSAIWGLLTVGVATTIFLRRSVRLS